MHRLLTWQFEKLICIHAFDSPTRCRGTLKKTPQGWQNVHISGENAGSPQVWTERHPSGKHFYAVRFSCCAGTGQNRTGGKKKCKVQSLGQARSSGSNCSRVLITREHRTCARSSKCQQSQLLSKQQEKGLCIKVLNKQILFLLSYCVLVLDFYCPRLIKGWVFKKRRQKEN